MKFENVRYRRSCVVANSEEWITIPTAASILGTGKKAVLKLIKSGRLTSRDVPGSYVRVLKTEIEALANQCTQPRAS